MSVPLGEGVIPVADALDACPDALACIELGQLRPRATERSLAGTTASTFAHDERAGALRPLGTPGARHRRRGRDRPGELRGTRWAGQFPGGCVQRLEGGRGTAHESLANEWAPHGVTVNAIAPGYVKTRLNRHIWRDDPARSEAVLGRLPAGRWGEPDELAGAVVVLSSAASNYVHGIVLPVDGGWLGR